MTARKLLQANHTLITIAVTSTEIKTVTDQTQFFGHGLVEGIKRTDKTPLFTKSTTTAESIVPNNVKILTAKNAFGVAEPSTQIGAVSSKIKVVSGAGITTKQKGKVSSSKRTTGSVVGDKIITEVQVGKNPYIAGSSIKAGDNNVFVVLAVTGPSAEAGTGTVINIADTNYSISGDGSPGDTFPKTFVTQYLNRYN